MLWASLSVKLCLESIPLTNNSNNYLPSQLAWARRDSRHLIPVVLAHSVPTVPHGRQAGTWPSRLVILPPEPVAGVCFTTALWGAKPRFVSTVWIRRPWPISGSQGEVNEEWVENVHVGLEQAPVTWLQRSPAILVRAESNAHLVAVVPLKVKVGVFLGLSVYRMMI